MILGLNSLEVTTIRVGDPLHGESDQDLGSSGGDKSVGLEEMAQGPLRSGEHLSPGGDHVHAKRMHEEFASGPAGMQDQDVNGLGDGLNITGTIQEDGPMQTSDYMQATVEMKKLDNNVYGVGLQQVSMELDVGLGSGVHKMRTSFPTAPCNSSMAENTGGILLLCKKCGVFGQKEEGKGIMDDGFIKVVRKKKKSNDPKSRVQVPKLNVSKLGLSKPPGRPKPNVVIGPSPKAQNLIVDVSNPLLALDDNSDDSTKKLHDKEKSEANRYVYTSTIPPHDIFMTRSTSLKDYYYYSLAKDDMEEVELETDGTERLISTGVPERLLLDIRIIQCFHALTPYSPPVRDVHTPNPYASSFFKPFPKNQIRLYKNPNSPVNTPLTCNNKAPMSYYNQSQPPVGVPPPQGYPPEGYPKDAYPPPGYPPQGYPPQQGYPQQGYPPQYAPPYGAPPPQQQQQQQSGGFMEGCLAALCCCCLLDACF
ncbi:hypothetical protein L1987_02035 [Smallanthus sonchifolius]|uniref:Uncharacterized protein n=1 Tax=Smallanthus sonchifolius TaxID=185202 RepID=A0ACB9K6P5_9ASTR|nr:hypothetical protein L1987_02035 [Smallanthus sonchifolius]